MNGSLRMLFARLALFVCPFALLLAAPAYVLVRSGEITALDVVRAAQRQVGSPERLLFGPAYSDCTKRYKLFGALEARPQVLVLGTSRTMELRAAMFDPHVRFYNAGGGASRLVHFRQFLARLPAGAQPELLLIGLDPWFLNAQTEARAVGDFDTQVAACTTLPQLVQSSWTTVYSDWLRGKFALGALDAVPAIGLNAMVNGNGFRNDGSFLYGRIINAPDDPDANPDFQFREALQHVAVADHRFESAADVGPELLAELDRFLDEAARRSIHVIGFLPPYAPRVLDAMTRSGRYGYISRVFPAAQPLFERRNFSLFDFTDARSLGSTDAEFVDGLHASEVAQLRMLRAMLRRDELLGRYTHADLLDALASAARSPLALANSERWR